MKILTKRIRWMLLLSVFSSLACNGISQDITSATVTVPGSSTARTAGSRFGQVVNVMDYGAVGDGSTNDWAAFAAAFAVGGHIVAPAKTFKLVVPSGSAGLSLPANSSFQGEGIGKTILCFYDSGQFLQMLRVSGINCSLQDFSIQNYATAALDVAIEVGAANNLNINGVSIDGRSTSGASTHGILVDDTASPANVQISKCLFYRCNYGLFTTNTFTGTATDWRVTNCSFSNSYADDLEFNAPSGLWTGVVVANCNFDANQYSGPSGGFGIGFAHVVNAVISANTFNSYIEDAIHLEDRCSSVAVSGNSLYLCPKGIWVFSTNSNRISIVGNTAQGATSAMSGTPAGAFTSGIYLVDDSTYPDHCVVSNNVCSNYDIGMVIGRSSPTSVVSGNLVLNCCVGYGFAPNSSIRDNTADSCTYAIQYTSSAGLLGRFIKKSCANLFYVPSGTTALKITFLGLDVQDLITIGAGATVYWPLFPTPTKMYGESVGYAEVSGTENLTSASLLTYSGTLTETNHYIVGVGPIGAGSRSITGGNLCFVVYNAGGSVNATIQHTFTGAVTFN